MKSDLEETFSVSTGSLDEAVEIAREVGCPIFLLVDLEKGGERWVKIKSEQELRDIYPGLLAQSETGQVVVKKFVLVQKELIHLLRN